MLQNYMSILVCGDGETKNDAVIPPQQLTS